MSWRTLLVLGGTGSGRSDYAESLLAGDPDVAGDPDGADVRRVPAAGSGGDLTRLASTLAEAKPDETLLVEDLAGWLSGERGTGEPDPQVLVEAVRACPAARVVLVSSEVGLAPVPSAATSRQRTLAMGALNRALADTVDAAVLVVAGQPVWLKPAGAPPRAVVAAAPAATALAGALPDLSNLKDLPSPDDYARRAALERLAAAGTAQLGALDTIVSFAAGTQGRDRPTPWRQVRVLVLHGDHAGAAGAGAADGGSSHRVAGLHDGTSPLAQLATAAGAGAGGTGGVDVQVVDVAAAAPIEDGPAMPDEDAAEQAMAYGWRLAEQAADEGVEALVLASIGDGADTAAAAAVSVLATNTEPASLLARVRTAEGTIDDQAWIRRCAAVRDAVHRVRTAGRTAVQPVLADLAGADIATATGLLLGATARRTPVLLDGPVGVAAVLAARSLAASARHWCLLPDHNGHPTVVRVSEQLGMAPLLNLRLDLGEGTTSLAALPLLRTALALATTLPVARDAG